MAFLGAVDIRDGAGLTWRMVFGRSVDFWRVWEGGWLGVAREGHANVRAHLRLGGS